MSGEESWAGGELLVTRRPGVVEVVFNRPERHNAFTTPMYEALLELCGQLAGAAPDDPGDPRVLVLRGAGGRAFAAGNDIAEFTGLAGGAAGVRYEAGVQGVLRALLELPQVTLAVIDGLAVGGGLAVATHCDLRICTQTSRMGYPIARTLGNALSAPVLDRCVAVFGESVTREMLLASRLVDAARAHAVGAVLQVVPASELDGVVATLVDGLLLAAPRSLATTKRQLLPTAERPSADSDSALLESVYGSADFREGVRAFLAREKPRFTGR